MKKLCYVGHEKLINMIDRHGWHFGYFHGCQSYPRNDHLCSKSAQKRYLLLGIVLAKGNYNHSVLMYHM